MRKYERIILELSKFKVGEIHSKEDIKEFNHSFFANLVNAGYALHYAKGRFILLKEVNLDMGITWMGLKKAELSKEEIFRIKIDFYRTNRHIHPEDLFVCLYLFLEEVGDRKFHTSEIIDKFDLPYRRKAIKSYLWSLGHIGVLKKIEPNVYVVNEGMGDYTKITEITDKIHPKPDRKVVEPAVTMTELQNMAKKAGLISNTNK